MSEIRVKKNHYFRKSLYLITAKMRNLPCFSAKIKILGPKSGNFSPFSCLYFTKKLVTFVRKAGVF